MSAENSTLTNAFATIGRKYGYDEVEAEFAPFRDFKVKWTRSYKWISFEVSDYLNEASENILEELAETIFKKIVGDGDMSYTEDVTNYLTSEEFVTRKQNVFVRRVREVKTEDEGRRMLTESYNRLVRMGLVEKDPLLRLEWSAKRSNHVGSGSMLMKVILMNEALENEDIDEDLLDYCVYSEILKTQGTFGKQQEERKKMYDEMITMFPSKPEMDRMVMEMGLSLF